MMNKRQKAKKEEAPQQAIPEYVQQLGSIIGAAQGVINVLWDEDHEVLLIFVNVAGYTNPRVDYDPVKHLVRLRLDAPERIACLGNQWLHVGFAPVDQEYIIPVGLDSSPPACSMANGVLTMSIARHSVKGRAADGFAPVDIGSW